MLIARVKVNTPQNSDKPICLIHRVWQIKTYTDCYQLSRRNVFAEMQSSLASIILRDKGKEMWTSKQAKIKRHIMHLHVMQNTYKATIKFSPILANKIK